MIYQLMLVLWSTFLFFYLLNEFAEHIYANAIVLQFHAELDFMFEISHLYIFCNINC